MHYGTLITFYIDILSANKINIAFVVAAMSIGLAHRGTRIDNVLNALDQIEDKRLDDARKILVKPNLTALYHDYANTSVETTRVVIEWLRDHTSASIEVGEGSGTAYYSGKTTLDVFRRLGYDLLEVPLIDFNEWASDTPYQLVEVETIHGPRKMRVRETDHDYVVSIAIPKTHDYALATFSIKNMMGLIHPDDRIMMHGAAGQSDIAGPLVNFVPLAVKQALFPLIPQWVASRLKNKRVYLEQVRIINRNLVRLFHVTSPSLAVIDGYYGMEGYGPVQGDPLLLGVAIASSDPLRADALGAALMGFNPRDIGYLVLLEESGAGSIDVANIDYGGLVRNLRPHRDYKLQLQWR